MFMQANSGISYHASFSTKSISNDGSIDSRGLEQIICSGFKVFGALKFYINFKIRGECEFCCI